MESGQDAGALASPVQEGDPPAAGAGSKALRNLASAGTAEGGTAEGGTAEGGTAEGGTAEGGIAEGGIAEGALPGGKDSGGGAKDEAPADGGRDGVPGGAAEHRAAVEGDGDNAADGDVGAVGAVGEVRSGAIEDEAAADGGEDEVPTDSDEDADGDGNADGEPGRPAPAPVWAAGMAVLLAVLIAGVVVSLVFLGRVNGSGALSSRQQAAVAAARNAVADLTTADYQHPQQYLQKLRGDATGSFLNMFTNSAAGFGNVLQQGKVQTTGNVVDVGVQQIGTDTAQLSVLADVTVKNSQTPRGSQRAYRLSVSMISAGSHWLVSNVVFVQ